MMRWFIVESSALHSCQANDSNMNWARSVLQLFNLFSVIDYPHLKSGSFSLASLEPRAQVFDLLYFFAKFGL